MPNTPEPGSVPESKSGVVHLRALTGLRFVAAFFVFYHHIRRHLVSQEELLPLGGPAVSLFFVLSGFILTWVYHSSLAKERVKRFYVTRLARIWPLHIVCLLICLLLVSDPPGSNADGANSWASLFAQFFMVQSWIPVTHWFLDFNAVSWSISTEAFFYLTFPLLVLGNRKWFWLKFLVVGCVAFASLGLTQYLANTDQVPAWMSMLAVSISLPLVRLLEFVLGMASCFLFLRRHSSILPDGRSNRWQFCIHSAWELLTIVCVVVWWLAVLKLELITKINQSTHFGVVFGKWFSVANGMLVFALTIYAFAQTRGVFGRILSSRLAVWLGEISFAFYLIHQVVIVSLDPYLASNLQFVVICFVVSLLASALLYRLIEMPMRNAIVACYDGRSQRGREQLMGGVRSLYSTRSGLVQITCLVGLPRVCRNGSPRSAGRQSSRKYF